MQLFFFFGIIKTVKGKHDLTREEREKMELENIKKTIEDLERQGFDIFYTKGNDADSVKVYEDSTQVIYINYNYAYIDIISK